MMFRILFCALLLGSYAFAGSEHEKKGAKTDGFYKQALERAANPIERRPIDPPNKALEKRLQLFCSDPVEAICKGEAGKKARNDANLRFRESKFGKLADSEEMKKLKAPLYGGKEKYPEKKDDAWWGAYEKYAMARMKNATQGLSHADFESVRKSVLKTAALPGYFGKNSTAISAIEKLRFILSAEDLKLVKDPADKRKIVEAIYETCEKEGTDNAFNFKSQFIVFCPERMERALFRRSESKFKTRPATGLRMTIGHELGHNCQWLGHQKFYGGLEACLLRHHNAPGADKAPHILAAEIQPFLNEITADYWGGVELGEAIDEVPEEHKFDALAIELEQMCDSMGTQWEFPPLNPGGGGVIASSAVSEINTHVVGLGVGKAREPSHPRGDYRIRFMGGLPFLRAKIGCDPAQRLQPPACAIGGVSPPAKF